MAKLTIDQLKSKLGMWAQLYPDAVERAFRMTRPVITTDVKETQLSGQVLGVRTGRLRNSIKGILAKDPPRMSIGTFVFYGAIWFERGRDFLTKPIERNLPLVERTIAREIIREYENA